MTSERVHRQRLGRCFFLLFHCTAVNVKSVMNGTSTLLSFSTKVHARRYNEKILLRCSELILLFGNGVFSGHGTSGFSRFFRNHVLRNRSYSGPADALLGRHKYLCERTCLAELRNPNQALHVRNQRQPAT